MLKNILLKILNSWLIQILKNSHFLLWNISSVDIKWFSFNLLLFFGDDGDVEGERRIECNHLELLRGLYSILCNHICFVLIWWKIESSSQLGFSFHDSLPSIDHRPNSHFKEVTLRKEYQLHTLTHHRNLFCHKFIPRNSCLLLFYFEQLNNDHVCLETSCIQPLNLFWIRFFSSS